MVSTQFQSPASGLKSDAPHFGHHGKTLAIKN
jgi:hypothetical protein